MNVLEAYIKFNKQLIIVISGISGCNKTSVAKQLAHSFKISFINQFEYYNKDYEQIDLPDNSTGVNFATDDAVDWNNFNKDVEKLAGNGVIISALSLPDDKITFNVDYHIHLSMSKQQCIESRHRFLTKHKDKYPAEAKQIGSRIEKWKMNNLTYPYYLKSVKLMKIDNFFTVKNHDDKQLWSHIFDIIINEHIVPFTTKFAKSPKYIEWLENNKDNTTSSSSSTSSVEEPDDEEFDTGEEMTLDSTDSLQD